MAANPIDLCTLADVKDYLGIRSVTATGDDAKIQRLITSASQYWLTRTSRGSLNSVASYSERYDGNDRDTLILEQFPIVSVSRLLIDGIPVSQSTDYTQPGWAIDQLKTAIVLIGTRQWFWCGRMNVQVDYTAGYPSVPWDVNEAVIKQVAVMYKRSNTIDQASQMIGQGEGETRYRSWELPPEVERVLCSYGRYHP